jgi:hypothetical protein|nr:MAG TPA: hypothetical protein [Bacteriophage sp.]
MNNPKEFTQDEFNRFVEKNNLEVFTKAQVDAFSKDVIEKSKNKEIDEFEIACCTADYMSLKPVFVRSNDLMKSLMFYREAQREPVEIPDGIFKSIDDRMCFCYKETPLNILKGIAGINCADDVAIEKAKALPLGTEKMYGGKMYVKTEKGWRLKKKGTTGTGKESETKESKKEDENGESKRTKEIRKELIKEYLENPEVMNDELSDADISLQYRKQILKKILDSSKGLTVSKLKPGDIVYANSNPRSSRLTYKGEENGKHIFETQDGKVEKTRSKTRLFFKKDELVDESALVKEIVSKMYDHVTKNRDKKFGNKN